MMHDLFKKNACNMYMYISVAASCLDPITLSCQEFFMIRIFGSRLKYKTSMRKIPATQRVSVPFRVKDSLLW